MRVATDIGGTFTDLVYVDETTGEVGLAKASTTPPEFEQGVLDALDKASIGDADITSFVHGSTVIINALTERKGAVTALITTRGFRDVLEIARSNRPALFDLRFTKPKPFVPRYLRYEVRERLDYRGNVLEELDRAEVARVAQAAVAAGAEAVAICFLHSYLNPEHEAAAAQVVREVAPSLFVTCSHEITREWREYERSSTTVLNAYVKGVAATYLDRLEGSLRERGIGKSLYIMQSSGGVMSFAQAKETPISMLESGPVAGVIGAAAIGKLIGSPNLITLDIGGTTAKASLIDGGEVKVSTEYAIEWKPDSPGYPVRVPVVDIVEIGAGGGSIAWFDEAGGLRVGPRSAGAVPGPACYPNGGAEPTVTDANLLAGRIDPDYFLGGEIAVSKARAAAALEQIADPLGVTVEEAALGVIRLANANMVNAIKLVSVRRGYDPRDFDLVAFGGGGSMHAPTLAPQMQIGRVIVPPAPGLFSAWGMLVTEPRRDWVLTRVLQTNRVAESTIDEVWQELESAAATYFAETEAATGDLVLARFADIRYKGQEHAVKVPIGRNGDSLSLAQVEARFHDLHEQHYTFRLDVPLEFVSFHLTAFAPREATVLPRIDSAGADGVAPARKGSRSVDFDDHGHHEATIYDRSLLGAGAALAGPAVIEDAASSTVVLPGQGVSVDDWGNLIIEIDG